MKVTESASSTSIVPIEVWFSTTEKEDGDVIVGAEVSTTLTVLVAVAELPEASVAMYVTVYEPIVPVSTSDEEVTVTVSRSVAVAPASV